MENDLSEYFSELNLTKLKKSAVQWARWHPVIEKILLFEQNPLVDEESKYILVAVIPHLERPLKIKKEYEENRRRALEELRPKKRRLNKKKKNLSRKRVLKEIEELKNQEKKKFENLSEEEQMAVRAWEWSSPDCLHIQSALEKVYLGVRRQDIIGRWMWLHAFNPKIEETDIADSVIHESRIVLYDQAPQEEKKKVTPFEHSSDFCYITKDGEHFTFTLKQGKALQILSEASEKGTPVLHQKTIIQKVSPNTSTKRLRDIFKSRLDAYKKLIESVSSKELKGGVRLKP